MALLLHAVSIWWAVTLQLCTILQETDGAECQEPRPQAADSLLSRRASPPKVTNEKASDVALPTISQPEYNPRANHIYLSQASMWTDFPESFQSRENCKAYEADPDFQRARDASRYPWHDGIFAPNNGESGQPWGAALYGTSYAQDAIFKHQHPDSCEGKKFLQFAVHGFGPGSNIHTIGEALAEAMNADRILVLPPRAEDGNLVWYDEDWCPGARGWECWVQPVAGCLPTADSDVTRMGFYDLAQTGRPSIFNELLGCSGIPPEKHFYWWRAQSAAYLVRFNEKTRSALDAMRQKLLFETHDGEVWPLSTAGARSGGVAMLVRHGDKAGEMEFEPSYSYVDAAEKLFSGNQLPVKSGSSIFFSFPSDAFAGRKAFVHSEDVQVMQMFRSLSDGSERTGNDQWTLSFMNSTCQGWCDPNMVVANMGPRHGLMMYMLHVEESLRNDAFICPLQSNWCRLIDELRMTIAGKAAAPFIDISENNKGSRQCIHCYLGWLGLSGNTLGHQQTNQSA